MKTETISLSMLLPIVFCASASGATGSCFHIHSWPYRSITTVAVSVPGGSVIPDNNLAQTRIIEGILEPVRESLRRDVKDRLSEDGVDQISLRDRERLKALPAELQEFLAIERTQTRAPDGGFYDAVSIFQKYRQTGHLEPLNPLSVSHRGPTLPIFALPVLVYKEALGSDFLLSSDGQKIIPRPDTEAALAKFIARKMSPTVLPTLKLEVERADPKYQEALKVLESADVGGKGRNAVHDRTIVADVFFAKKSSVRQKPLIFATYDLGIALPLLRLKGLSEAEIGLIRKELSSGEPPSLGGEPVFPATDVVVFKNLQWGWGPFYQFVFMGVSDIPLQVRGEKTPRRIDIVFGKVHKPKATYDPEIFETRYELGFDFLAKPEVRKKPESQ